MKQFKHESLVDELTAKLVSKDHNQKTKRASFPPTGDKSVVSPEAESTFPVSGDKSGVTGGE